MPALKHAPSPFQDPSKARFTKEDIQAAEWHAFNVESRSLAHRIITNPKTERSYMLAVRKDGTWAISPLSPTKSLWTNSSDFEAAMMEAVDFTINSFRR